MTTRGYAETFYNPSSACWHGHTLRTEDAVHHGLALRGMRGRDGESDII